MDAVATYLNGFLRSDPPKLADLDARSETIDRLQPEIGADVGRLLGLLVRMLGARRVLELGSSIGYSALWLAAALRETGGRLTSVEIDPRLAEEARLTLRSAGYEDLAEIIVGDARDVLPSIEGPFDLILQDADKRHYPELLDRCVDLLRPGGVLAADDALFLPMGVREELSAPVDRYNRRAAADPRLYTIVVPLGDGLALSWKRP